MPVFFQLRHILIISACFNLLHLAFNKSVGFLHLIAMHVSGKTFFLPRSDLQELLMQAGLYSLTLAALMMVSLRSMQLVFTDDKFSFTSMDIRHRPLRNLVRYAMFGLLFCAMRFVAILLLCLPLSLMQILAEQQWVDLRSIALILLDNPAASFVIDFTITCFALHVLLRRKYLSKRLCLIQTNG